MVLLDERDQREIDKSGEDIEEELGEGKIVEVGRQVSAVCRCGHLGANPGKRCYFGPLITSKARKPKCNSDWSANADAISVILSLVRNGGNAGDDVSRDPPTIGFLKVSRDI